MFFEKHGQRERRSIRNVNYPTIETENYGLQGQRKEEMQEL